MGREYLLTSLVSVVPKDKKRYRRPSYINPGLLTQSPPDGSKGNVIVHWLKAMLLCRLSYTAYAPTNHPAYGKCREISNGTDLFGHLHPHCKKADYVRELET